MTALKLAIIALGIVALIAGVLLVKHDPVAGGTLLAIGGKLIGLAFPEIGAKKSAAAAVSVDETVHIIPPPSPLLVLFLLGLAVHQQGCATLKPPCDETKLRAIDLDYEAKVVAECLPKYDSKEACPRFAELQADHRRNLTEACPQ